MAFSSSFGDISLGDMSGDATGLHSAELGKVNSQDPVIDRKTVDELADALLRGRFFLTALEFHAELQEAGLDLPKFRQFFSNPANVDQKARIEHSLCRSPSQQTFDSIEFDRMSDVNNTEQDRVAVLEYELRKAKETIKRYRENVTVQSSSNAEANSEVPEAAQSQPKACADDTSGPAMPIEHLEKRALNFLVHEFVLKNNNKMTAVTFAEENTDQDFDDWDDVGLNTARPPTLLQLYRRFLHYRETKTTQATVVLKQDAETNTVNDSKPSESTLYAAEKSKNESLLQKIEELEQKLKKSKVDGEREISRLMFENERVVEENKRLKKQVALSVTNGLGGPLRSDVSAYSVASTTGALDEADQQTVQQEPDSPTLKVKAEPCQQFPSPVCSKILSLIDQRTRSASQGIDVDGSHVHEDLEKLRSSFSPYDCTLCWQFYKDVKKYIPAGQQDGVVSLLVWLMLKTVGDLREEITHELLSLFGQRCDLRHVSIIVSALMCYADLANIQEVQSHLLAVCWEQINDRDPSRRLVVASLCGPLACYLEPQIRSSLLFSILNQLLSEDKDVSVRLTALDSLVQVLMYLDDHDKLPQLSDLYVSIVTKDTNEKLVCRAQTVYLPMLVLWCGHQINYFSQILQMVLKLIRNGISASLVGSLELLNHSLVGFQHILPVIVFRCTNTLSTMSVNSVNKDAWHAESIKLSRIENDIFDWPTLEPDQLKLKRMLEKLDFHVTDCIERSKSEGTDKRSLLSLPYSQPFALVCQEIFPLVVELAANISCSAKSELSLIIRITCFITEMFGPTVSSSLLAPLFIQHVQTISDKLGMALVKSEHLAKSGFVAVYCAFLGCCSAPLRDEIAPLLLDCIVALSTSQRDLVPILTAFSMLAPLSHLQVLLSLVWDCVVHSLPAVRSSAAHLAEHMISLVDTSVLSSRLFSALVTLSNDPQMSVRLATLGPLVALLTQTDNAQLLEKVYFQLQQVLDDPQCANDTSAHIRAVVLFTQIIPNVDPKFRDDFILQRFAVMAAQNNHCQDRTARQAVAEALVNAYNTANCCYIPETTVRRLIVPALKCLSVDFQTLGLKSDEDKLNVLIKEVDAKLSNQHSVSVPGGFSLPVTSQLSFSATQKDRTGSVASVTSNSPAASSFGQSSPASAALGSIMASPSAQAAAEAAKSKLAKFKQQSKTFFNK